MRVLIVEDDKTISENVKKFLGVKRFVADSAGTFSEGIYLAETEDYDVIILDWTLPDGNGLELCRQLRDKKIATPIIFLTARTQEESKLQSFNSGADDYLLKPFSLEELLARIMAITRRSHANQLSSTWKVAELEIDTASCEVKKKGVLIALSPKEFSLLEYLAQNRGKAIDRMTLLSHVWGEEIDPLSNTIDVHIRFLRKKIGDEKGEIIKTIKGKGYLLC